MKLFGIQQNHLYFENLKVNLGTNLASVRKQKLSLTNYDKTRVLS